MGVVMLVIHVVVCIGLILAVLLQSGKGGGLAGAFGGMDGPGAVFGGRGAATFLSKMTTIFAIVFVLSCIVQVRMPKNVGARIETASERQADQRTPVPAAMPETPMEAPAEAVPEPAETPVESPEQTP